MTAVVGFVAGIALTVALGYDPLVYIISYYIGWAIVFLARAICGDL